MTRSLPLIALVILTGNSYAEAPRPIRVTSFSLAHLGVDDQTAARVERVIDESLKKNPRLDLKDLDTRLADFAQDLPEQEIEAARRLLAEGQKALATRELSSAIRKLGQAIDALSKVLPHIKKQELADAMMSLGVAEFEIGDRKASHATLVRLFTWRSDYKVDTNKVPLHLVGPAEEARKEVEQARHGSIEIESEPSAATAYVDGKYVGLTPCPAEGLAVGEHFITIKKERYKKAVERAIVSARVQEAVRVPLERSEKALIVEQALTSAEKEIGAARLSSATADLEKILFIDHGVFVRVSPTEAPPSSVKVEAYLYDLKNRRRLSQVQKVVHKPIVDKDLSQLTALLYTNVSYSVELQAPVEAPPPKVVKRPPFYKTWWFWTASIAATLVIVVPAATVPAPLSCGDNARCYRIVN